MTHIDLKRLSRIERQGNRISGDRTGPCQLPGIGWEVLHVAIHDASRLANTEVLISTES